MLYDAVQISMLIRCRPLSALTILLCTIVNEGIIECTSFSFKWQAGPVTVAN